MSLLFTRYHGTIYSQSKGEISMKESVAIFLTLIFLADLMFVVLALLPLWTMVVIIIIMFSIMLLTNS